MKCGRNATISQGWKENHNLRDRKLGIRGNTNGNVCSDKNCWTSLIIERIVTVPPQFTRWISWHFDANILSEKSIRMAIQSANFSYIRENRAVQKKTILNSGDIVIVSLSTDYQYSNICPCNRISEFFNSIMKEMEWCSIPNWRFLVAPSLGVNNDSSTQFPIPPR